MTKELTPVSRLEQMLVESKTGPELLAVADMAQRKAEAEKLLGHTLQDSNQYTGIYLKAVWLYGDLVKDNPRGDAMRIDTHRKAGTRTQRAYAKKFRRKIELEKDTGRWCLIPFAMLCAVFQDLWQQWLAEFKNARQKTPRRDGSCYHSECVFVPRREVWAEIYKKFGGSVLH